MIFILLLKIKPIRNKGAGFIKEGARAIRIKWSDNFAIPQIFKNLIPENIYKLKLLKIFIIVAMMRNYVAPKKNNK